MISPSRKIKILMCKWFDHKWTPWVWMCLPGTLPTQEYPERLCKRCWAFECGPVREQPTDGKSYEIGHGVLGSIGA